MTTHPPHPFDLGGKIALVTGSNTGLGAGMARALAAAGCDIVGVSRSDDSDNAQQVKALGRRYVGVSADLSNIAQTKKGGGPGYEQQQGAAQ